MKLLSLWVVLMSASIVSYAQLPSAWDFARLENGKSSVSSRTAVLRPKDGGFAVLKVEKGAGKGAGVKLVLIIENPKLMPKFPFGSFEGPVDKTTNDFMTFQASVGGRKKEMKCAPNGGYAPGGGGGFQFSTINSRMISFMKGLSDGSCLRVKVHAEGNEAIEVEFKTDGLVDGLKKLSD